jgi:thioredoxin-like negative regulator of GroEL
LFVDVWANWCHTCLSLQQYVFPDPALTQHSAAFVWLSIDSERAENAAFLRQFQTRNWPTLWVIDPASEQPLLKWIGSATAQELSLLLTQVAKPAALPSADAAPAQTPSAARTVSAPQATALWLRGNRASAAGDAAGAIALYDEALQGAPSDWPLRARVAEALSMRYSETQANGALLELAVREGERLEPGTARLNVVLNGVDAGSELAENAQAPAGFDALLQLAARIAQDPREPVLVDDRSSLYLSVVTALSKREPAQAASLARAWSSLLDAEAARAPLPAARRVWDAHRLEAYTALGETARALPMLQQSEHEVPDDYNPPARLARAYFTLQRPQLANVAINQALTRCDGPRKLRLYMLKSEILLALHDQANARATLRQALDFAREKRFGPEYDKLLRTIERKLGELS